MGRSGGKFNQPPVFHALRLRICRLHRATLLCQRGGPVGEELFTG